MPLAQRVAGLVANYLGEKDEHAVITEAVAPPMERFNPSKSGADKKFLAVWSKVDLSHVCGFPVWEKEVFGLLSRADGELKSIFDYYAKSGTAGSASATSNPAGREPLPARHRVLHDGWRERDMPTSVRAIRVSTQRRLLHRRMHTRLLHGRRLLRRGRPGFQRPHLRRPGA